jgi:ABC-type dipeptide/oligopeptide/nickel transport system permease component
MTNYMTTFVNELNPKYDLNRPINAETTRTYIRSRFPNSIKSFFRGATIGGLVGLLIGVLSDADMGTCVNRCAQIGALADIFQYNLRHSMYTFRHLEWYRSLPNK